MVYTIWAVACTVVVLTGGSLLGGGCASTKSEKTDFSRMDVGEGPGATLRHLTELQKDVEGRSASTSPDEKSSAEPSSYSRNVPPPKPSELTRKEVPESDFITRQETKAAPPPVTAPSPPKAAPPPGNPPENEVPRQSSAGRIPTAAPLPPSTAGRVTSSTDPQYRIGPEDVLHVSVWGNAQLTMDVVVRPDGKISIPLAQDIQAEGFTASELADRIHNELLPFIKDPNVSVIVKQINAPKFSVIGYVNRPGTYPMRGDVTILQALSEAGGFTPFASPRKIKLVRNAGGKQETRVVNYYDMIEKGGKGNILLMPGDAIVVP